MDGRKTDRRVTSEVGRGFCFGRVFRLTNHSGLRCVIFLTADTLDYRKSRFNLKLNLHRALPLSQNKPPWYGRATVKKRTLPRSSTSASKRVGSEEAGLELMRAS